MKSVGTMLKGVVGQREEWERRDVEAEVCQCLFAVWYREGVAGPVGVVPVGRVVHGRRVLEHEPYG